MQVEFMYSKIHRWDLYKSNSKPKKEENEIRLSIKTKIIGNKSYFYLNYRDGKKVISKYIGKEENASFVKEQLERRHHIELMIKKLKQEQRQIKKLEALL